ncbi:mitoguardin isoform X2 [Bombus huntii]|uniref:mitoguardin isoform X2 n=1 Tax=Bombus huntii TaxID=85661 RepID=UPI0021AA6B74|nr:mitoguardin isoform X2 [Bombus huntii]
MRKLLGRINILHILHTIRLNCGESLVKYSLCIVFRDACCTLRFNRSTYVYREVRIGQGVYNGYANITGAGSARVLGKFPSSPAHQAPPSICWYAVLLLHLRHSLLFEIQRIQGLEALEKALYCWEDALTAFSSSFSNGTLALPSAADAAFTQDVQELLDMGYQIQNHAELLFIDQHSVLFRNEDEESIDSHKPSNIGSRISGKDKADAASSPESFESARDGVADLREFEEFSEFFPHFEKQKLYHAALKQHEDKSILCRRLHTELVKCGSDIEYLAKVHCLRQAYTKLFTISSATEWIADIGRQVISDLIMYADRDPKDYLMHYERMLEFLQEPSNHNMMEEELTGRGVKCINFYDVLIDFILLDAFEEVEKPPSSIKAILQNRWISASFRETAIGTAVWSVLMGKRQMLKYDKGFLAHFYSISEQISPVLVWGFLGPEGSLRSTCHYFRDQVIEFLVDIFNFFKVRYTTVDNLAEDILREMKIRVENINQRLSLEGC